MPLPAVEIGSLGIVVVQRFQVDFWTASIDSNPGTDQASPIGIDAAPRPASIDEKSEHRYEIRFSASEGFIRKLERAKAICSRRPGLEAVLEKALDELLEHHDPERKEARREKSKSARRDQSEPVPTKTPNIAKNKTKIRSRHIPAGIRDAVFTRDGGRCTYVARNGVRCGATAHLQIDHVKPFCRGGAHTIDNLRLLCGKHNRLAARELLL